MLSPPSLVLPPAVLRAFNVFTPPTPKVKSSLQRTVVEIYLRCFNTDFTSYLCENDKNESKKIEGNMSKKKLTE